MQKFLPAFFFLFLTTGLFGQITLTTDYFPTVGDTLKYVVADSLSATTMDLIEEGGNDLAWDFSSLIGAGEVNNPVVAANSADFPTADLKILSNTTTSYYRSSATSFDLVGLETEFSLFPSLPLSTPVLPARPVRRAPLSLDASFTSVTANSLTISPDSIPSEILDELGPQIAVADSIRVTTEFTRVDEVDAYGTVRLLDNFYPVLREKRTEDIYVRVEIKAQGLPAFLDVTGTIALVNQDIGQLVGQQPTTVNYLFWNNDSKEPIVDVTLDEETNVVRRFNFKRAEQSTSTEGPETRQAIIRVYPNPATDQATFEVEGLVPGIYRLQLINMLGRYISDQPFTPSGNRTRLSLDVSTLPAGIYLYSLRDARGRRIVTKRLRVR